MKKVRDADSHEKGAGMWDQDPPPSRPRFSPYPASSWFPVRSSTLRPPERTETKKPLLAGYFNSRTYNLKDPRRLRNICALTFHNTYGHFLEPNNGRIALYYIFVHVISPSIKLTLPGRQKI